MDCDVVIAGAGPVGLLLACELRLAGVSVLVFEKLAHPNLPIKQGPVGGRALNIPSIEVFYRRGLLPALKKAALKWIDASMTREELEAALRGVAPSLDSGAGSEPAKIPPKFDSIFGTMFDANVVDHSDPDFAGRGPAAAYGVITMESLETLLSNRAADLQVEIRRGSSVTGFSADASGVTVHAGDTTVRSGWLVGCDGAKRARGGRFFNSRKTRSNSIRIGAKGENPLRRRKQRVHLGTRKKLADAVANLERDRAK